MQYTLSINQKSFQQIAPECDIIDAAIFDFIARFMATNCIEHKIVDGKIWYWISYKKIVKELPIINIKSKRAIYNRVDNLVQAGILLRASDNQQNSKSYFAQGENFSAVFFTPHESTFRGGMNIDSDPPMNIDSDNHNTNIDHNTNYHTKESVATSGSDEFPNSCEYLDDAKEIAQLLLDSICKWDTTHRLNKRSNPRSSWVLEIERAMRLDGRTREQLEFIIRYIFLRNTGVGKFWSVNIQSGGTLRDKFDRVKNEIKREVEKTKQSNVKNSSEKIRRNAISQIEKLDFEDA